LNVRKLLVSVTVCLGAASIGALFTSQSVDGWYVMLQKPIFTPPNWLFGPVWTTLYSMMGIAFYLVWHQSFPRKQKTISYILFAVQLLTNIGWSAVFFGLHSISGGMFMIIGLWVAIAATIQQFHKISTLAAWLLVPYLLWVSFAGLLNFGFWYLNK